MGLKGAYWRKSSYSGSDGGSCVEVATNLRDVALMRDSKDCNGLVLAFTSAEWHDFIRCIKSGVFETDASSVLGND